MSKSKLYVVVPDEKLRMKTCFYSRRQKKDAGNTHFSVTVSPEAFELFQTLERLYGLDGGNGLTDAVVSLYDAIFKAGVKFNN